MHRRQSTNIYFGKSTTCRWFKKSQLSCRLNFFFHFFVGFCTQTHADSEVTVRVECSDGTRDNTERTQKTPFHTNMQTFTEIKRRKINHFWLSIDSGKRKIGAMRICCCVRLCAQTHRRQSSTFTSITMCIFCLSSFFFDFSFFRFIISSRLHGSHRRMQSIYTEIHERIVR